VLSEEGSGGGLRHAREQRAELVVYAAGAAS
jgi:hypothetical protein